MAAKITIEFTVPLGYEQGDYAHLHGDGGGGDIDWNVPVTADIYPLFPLGAGLFGWGSAPWGNFRWGYAHSILTAGWGFLPWGHSPWGHGSAVIKAACEVADCGKYKFGLACYDKFGNPHEGAPEEIEVDVSIPPAAPSGLKKNSYNKETDVLILDVA